MQNWGTPKALFDFVQTRLARVPLTLDVCANANNAKLPDYYSLERKENGLTLPWNGRAIWCNPPYDSTRSWLRKMLLEQESYGMFLLAARTDTVNFQDFVFPFATRIWFIRRRVHFNGAVTPAPFPSLLAEFDPAPDAEAVHEVHTLDWKYSLID